MSFQHQGLGQGKWRELSLLSQMANIGSEVERTINWKNKGDKKYSSMALERALELIDFTIADPKNRKRLLEVSRVREFLLDHFLCGSNYGFSDKAWQDYFYSFAYAEAIR